VVSSIDGNPRAAGSRFQARGAAVANSGAVTQRVRMAGGSRFEKTERSGGAGGWLVQPTALVIGRPFYRPPARRRLTAPRAKLGA